MNIALTGATGYIGSHVLTELVSHGHHVTAAARNDAEAAVVEALGATPVVVDLFDPTSVTKLFNDADGAVHTASPGDETAAALDTAVVEAAIEAFGPNGNPFVYISGLWIYGDNADITEQSPIHAPPLVAWKEPIQQRILSQSGMRGVVIVSSVAYGDGGGGIPGVLLGSPLDDAGDLVMVGDGRQRWSSVHVADLSDFFRRVLEDDRARGTYVIGNGINPTVAELTEAAAVAAGAAGAVAGSETEARARFGDYFADVLLLDQSTQARRARDELGWEPTHAGLTDEFRRGSYRK
jgi:nucleoside-diphosphate-sugar epimerase